MFVATRFDRNVLQGIASRFEEGFGLDAKVIATMRDQLNMQFGGSLFQQRLTPGSTVSAKRNFPAARLGRDYQHLFTDLAYLQQTGEYLPNLAECGTYLVNTETSLVAPLSKRLAVKLGYVIRYNSAPPVRNNVPLKTTDTFFSSGIRFSY
jgi:putative salt-induced outer membrane protein